MSFSERYGYVPPKSIQHQAISDSLRTKLWNALCEFCFHDYTSGYGRITIDEQYNTKLYFLAKALWNCFFCWEIDTLGNEWSKVYPVLKKQFWELPWNRVLDFVEFVVQNYSHKKKAVFIKKCNQILEEEFSAYRFVSETIIDITSELEIHEIEKAMESPISAVNEHLKRSSELLAERRRPDYRNSIKESISAVEALCRSISGNPKQTLNGALESLEKGGVVKIHPSLKNAFIKIYAFTSDESGIRHSLFDEDNLDSEDAVFMLVGCSAFVNYLLAKARKSRIKIK